MGAIWLAHNRKSRVVIIAVNGRGLKTYRKKLSAIMGAG